MDKLKMHSRDNVAAHIEAVGRLFPHALTEVMRDGKAVPAIDFDVLRQELSREIVEGREERYAFTWPDKRQAILAANTPVAMALRPVVEDSVGRDGTPGAFDSENLYIEGDNLDVLKLLQETYLGKVKMIYIDPPYNTGSDAFVYDDDFAMENGDFKEANGLYDEDRNITYDFKTNPGNNGRFHTDWLNMIYPRLRVAKSLLADDGVIFISIDDNEVHNLRKVCDEIFGEQNFIGIILWKKKTNGNNMGFLPPVHDYILSYAKNQSDIVDMGYNISDEFIKKTYSNPDNDIRGPWTITDLSANHKGPDFPITNPKTGEVFYPPEGRYWVFNEREVKQRIADGRIIFGKGGNSRPVQKVFLSSRKQGKIRAESWWEDSGLNADATAEQKELFLAAKLFVNPKPVKLIKNILEIATDKDALILDFFSGSATTAHAVMQLNAEDGGSRKFIMVQLPEVTDEKSEAYRAGYENICEIGKERIRRAGAKIAAAAGEKAAGLDLGFRCLRLDTSNMTEVYYAPDAVTQDGLFAQVDNVKADRTPEDLLFQTMLDLGILLSSSIVVEEVAGRRVFNVADGFLLACFDRDVTDEVVTAIAQRRPYYAVFRDASMADDSALTNFDQLFAAYSPATVRRVL